MSEERAVPSWLRALLVAEAFVGIIVVAATFYVGQTVLRLTTEIEEKQRELDGATQRLTELQAKLTAVEKQLEADEKALQATTNLKQYEHPVGMMTVKEMFGRSQLQRQAQLLLSILELKDRTGWRVGGRTPTEGFDSPRFAAYLLQNRHLRDVSEALGNSVNSAQDAIRQALPSEPEPAIGDVVFYSTGYTMFFFKDERGKAFVIGMTPFGVLALDPSFANIIGYGKVFEQ